MARVSRIKIDKDLESEIFNQFWSSLARINDSGKTSEFFSDLLSETESLMLAKRFTAAILIVRGRPATEIRNSIHLSYSAIGTVAAWVKNGKPETKRILTKISVEKNWEAVLDTIDSILDKIPPRRHSDWKEEYAKKRKRTNQRLSRKSLR